MPSLERIDAPPPVVRVASAEQLELLGAHKGYRVTASGRVVACVVTSGGHNLGWIEPGATERSILNGLWIEPSEPIASPDGRRVLIPEPTNRRMMEIDLDAGEGRVAFELNVSWSPFQTAEYVTNDLIAYVWGSELWALHRLPVGWERVLDPAAIASAKTIKPFLGKYCLAGRDVVAFQGRTVRALGVIDVDDVDANAIAVKDGVVYRIANLDIPLPKIPITAQVHPGPVAFDALLPAGSVFGHPERVYAVTPRGRMLGEVDGKLAWQELDGTIRPIASGACARGVAHPLDERAIVYIDELAHDVTLGGATPLTPGHAAYAGDAAIAIIANGVVRVGDRELACAGHDRVWSVQYGKTIMTSGPSGAPAPRIYDLPLAFRSDVTVDAKPMPPALRPERGRIVGVRGVVERDGQYYVWGSAQQGNFRLVGL